jgi:SSS family solute:Na+ symporter
VKDVFVLGAAIFGGIAIPFASSAGRPFHGTVRYVSTVLLTGLGFYIGPQTFNAVFSARSENTLRRNAMLLPFYQCFLILMLFAGFASALIVPELKGTAVDQSFLLVVQHFYPSWVLGLIAAAGALAALIPASALILAGASVITKNVAGDIFGFATDDAARTLLTRVLVVVVAVLALLVWLVAQKTVVEMLLLYYNGITQFFPGVAATFLWRRGTALGVGAGIAAGLAVAIPLAAFNETPLGINPGFIGLIANVGVLALVSLASQRRSVQPRFELK